MGWPGPVGWCRLEKQYYVVVESMGFRVQGPLWLLDSTLQTSLSSSVKGKLEQYQYLSHEASCDGPKDKLCKILGPGSDEGK